MNSPREYLAVDQVHQGDARELLGRVRPESIALSVWSPPYYVGKSYEKDLSLAQWQELLTTVIQQHAPILQPGAFLVINIADILCFPDPAIPRFQAETHGSHRLPLTRAQVLQAQAENPGLNRYQLAALLGVSEQTVERRLKHNNIRGGKYAAQMRVKLVGGMLEEAAYRAGLYLYDRRVLIKDPAWENSRWHSSSYRAVDELEYLYFFWKPGITRVCRERLSKQEWAEWGSRGAWFFPSVRANDDHEAKFPLELPRRCIRLLTDPGDTVLDPFLGSGTTAAAAILEGRRYLGIEKMAKYIRVAAKTCAAAKMACP